MSDTPEIRECREAEVDALIDLWLDFSAEMARQDPHNELADIDLRSAQREYRREALADPDARTFVAVVDADDGAADGAAVADGARLVGYVTVAYESSAPVFARGDRIDVGELFVREADRGTGLADRLLDRCAEWGRERGCERVRLSVNVDNDRARAFYDRRGFEPLRVKLERSL
jgi:GNAT superfamily N-acetyltransferase